MATYQLTHERLTAESELAFLQEDIGQRLYDMLSARWDVDIEAFFEQMPLVMADPNNYLIVIRCDSW